MTLMLDISNAIRKLVLDVVLKVGKSGRDRPKKEQRKKKKGWFVFSRNAKLVREKQTDLHIS